MEIQCQSHKHQSDGKYKAQYTTCSHLTKTTVGVSGTEVDIKEEVE
jgi:hypothetical protein